MANAKTKKTGNMIGYYLRAANPGPDPFIVSFLKKNKRYLLSSPYIGSSVINILVTGLGAKKGAYEVMPKADWDRMMPLIEHLNLNMMLDMLMNDKYDSELVFLSLAEILKAPETHEETGEFLGMYPTPGWNNLLANRIAVRVAFYSTETGGFDVFSQVSANPADYNAVMENAIELASRCQQAWDIATGGLWNGVFIVEQVRMRGAMIGRRDI